jgi:hypothetical protein
MPSGEQNSGGGRRDERLGNLGELLVVTLEGAVLEDPGGVR